MPWEGSRRQGDWLTKRENTKVTKSLTRYKRYVQALEGSEKRVFEKRGPEVDVS